MSMAEVHIEESNNVKFAPFNGGYPLQSKHLSEAGLDISHNLWYDIFDHNDPGKTHANWALLPESEYEAEWFPAGPCEVAIPKVAAGSVVRVVEESSMQSFNFQQLVSDSKPTAKIDAPVLPPVETAQATAPAASSSTVDPMINNVLIQFLSYMPGASADVRTTLIFCLTPHYKLQYYVQNISYSLPKRD